MRQQDSGSPVLASFTRAVRVPRLVGRRAEWRAVRRALLEAREGSGRLVALTGEAGIGKTRLAQDAVAAAREIGFECGFGACIEDGHAPPFWPWLSALRTSETVDPAGDGSPRLSELLAAEGRADRRSLLAAPDEERRRLFDAVTAELGRRTRERPWLLVFEDLHAADEGTLRLLAWVVRALRLLPLAVVATYRDADLRMSPDRARWVGEIERAGEHLPLRRLAAPQVGELLEGVLGEVPPRALTDAVVSRSEGNPLFARELGLLLVNEARRSGSDAGALPLPPGVEATLRRRLSVLPARVREILGPAAAIGCEFDVALLEAATGIERAELCTRLEQAAAAGSVEPMAGTIGGWRFAHVLLRDLVYAEIESSLRAHLHGRIAAHLEARIGGRSDARLAVLAHHARCAFAGGGEARLALGSALRAGRHARSELAYEEAASHFESALAIVEVAGQAETPRLEALLALGDARLRAGQIEAARAPFREALALSRVAGDVEAMAAAALGLAAEEEDGLRADPERVALLEEVHAALEGQEGLTRVRVMSRLAEALYFLPAPERARALGQEAAALARQSGDPQALWCALNSLHWIDWQPENLDVRRAIADELLVLAAHVGGRVERLRAYGSRIETHLEAGRLAEADADLAVYAAIADELGDPRFRWTAACVRSLRELMSGRLVDAEAHARSAFEIGRDVQPALAHQWLAIQISAIRAEQRRFAEVEALARELAARDPTGRVHAGVGMLLLRDGRDDDACAVFHDLLSRAPWQRDINAPFATAAFGELAARFGEAEVVQRLHCELAPLAGHQIVIGLKVAWYGTVSRVLGLLALRVGDLEGAVGHLRAALAESEQLGAPAEAIRCRLGLAEALARRDGAGDAAEAEQLRADACTTRETLWQRAPVAPADARSAAAPAAAAGEEGTSRAALRLEGEVWRLEVGGESVHLRDYRGLHFLARLLRQPGCDLHVLELLSHRPGPAAERRSTSPAVERARVNVTRALRQALGKIEAVHPTLGRHLGPAIRTGTFCRYEPDPAERIEWDLD